MKAIFLCQQTDKIWKIYNEETIEAIKGIVDIEKRIYSKEELLASPESFCDVEIVFSTWGMPEMSETEIKSTLPSLKCVFYGAGSVQAFARPFLACGVKVFSAWAANAVPVAEMTVAEIILANKGYFVSSRVYSKEGRGAASATFARCAGNYGETVGIIGAGMIGKLVINMLKQYRLNVLVFDPFLSDDAADALGVRKCSLEEIFEKSFVVSNHLANNAQTVGMLNYALFERMRENAVFINTGRGAQVVEDDLVRILEERKDLTALLDVTYPEPPIVDHPFYTLENCIITPHIAGSAGDEVSRMGEYMLDECKAYVSGKPCKYEVSVEMLKTMA
ncbi:MAG: hydroxyacid dehydrogenase [Ruminococcaceae bacterium]|nr:hydroxyacid dehydrogenase [Oscillospiraceae bacterium]